MLDRLHMEIITPIKKKLILHWWSSKDILDPMLGESWLLSGALGYL